MAPNDINIAANTIVSGPIMVLDNGELTIDDKIPPGQDTEGDYDIIILDDGATINKKQSVANEGSDYGVLDLPVPDSLPEMPDFSGYLSMATSTNAYTVAPPLALDIAVEDKDGDGVIYYDVPGGITIESIVGSGTIVNTGDIVVGDNHNAADDVSSDVALISFGAVNVQQMTIFQGNTLIYGYETVYFGDSSYCAGNSALLADGGDDGIVADDIIMGGQSEFYGIIFADEGSVIIQPGSGGDANTRITGTVISGDSVDMNSNSEIIFDPSVFYTGDLFDLTTFFKTSVITTTKDWEELPPL